MQRLLSFILLFAVASPAQDFLLYRFDAACPGNTEVINYATGAMAFPSNGVLQDNTGAPTTTGVFGSALAGGSPSTNLYNRVVTGWEPSLQPMTGDITLAFSVRQANTFATTLPYLLGCNSGFRLFTNGVAGLGLVQRNIVASGGSPAAVDCELPAAVFDFQTRAAAGWVHIALVINSAAGVADWYVDGMPVHQQVGIGGGQINSPGSLMIGMYGTGSESAYDMDEFLLSNRAFTASEILVLALTPRAGEGDYNSNVPSQCGAGNLTVGSAGGTPTVGNSNYAIEIDSVSPSLYFLLPGLTRCSYGGAVPLPIDGTPILPELAGCWIISDSAALLSGVTAGVPEQLPLPLPATTGILGQSVFFQALAFDLATFNTSMSNGFAVGIGQ